MSKTGRSHLLRHTLPEIDVTEHFGTTDGKEIAKDIARMGQKELQAKFKTVYGAPTFSNNNNWLRRKLMEAAGLQTPKVMGTGQTSPRKHAHNLGDPGLDGGAFERLQGGIRRTKRQRKPKQYEDMMLGEGLDGDFAHNKAGQQGRSARAPLSIGDAYLQHQNAAYQASLGWQDTGDFLISPHMMGKHPYGGVGGAFGLPGLSEVVWPGAPSRGLRDNESGSSSEDQTAYEGGHHSHHSHSTHSHEGPAHARSPRAADKLVREIQEAIALLGGAGAAEAAAAAAAASGGFPGGRSLADLGFPSFEPHDLALPSSGSAATGMANLWGVLGSGGGHRGGSYPAGRGGSAAAAGVTGAAGSPQLNLQSFMRGGSTGLGERVGGNTPILEDFGYPLVNSPALLTGIGSDALDLSNRLPSLENPGDGRGRRSPSLGADLAALFPTLGSLEGRQVISQLGNGGVPSASDTPPRSAASSLDRILSDLGSSDVLDEHKIAAVPTAPARAVRGPGNLEGAAAPSMRFAGVPLLPGGGGGGASPRFQPPATPKAGASPAPNQAPETGPHQAPAAEQREGTPAEARPAKLTSVASLASWSREQLQEQAAAVQQMAAGTSSTPVSLTGEQTGTEDPAAAAAAVEEASPAVDTPSQQPEPAAMLAGAADAGSPGVAAEHEGEQKSAGERVEAERPDSAAGVTMDPFSFLQ